jgi:hypothetical protein
MQAFFFLFFPISALPLSKVVLYLRAWMETMYMMCRDSAEVGSYVAPVRQSAHRISSCISILPKKV